MGGTIAAHDGCSDMSEKTLYRWKFTPVADPDDPWWQGREIWRDLEVAAATAGEAQLEANKLYLIRLAETQPLRAEQDINPGFDDPRLYRVDRISDADG